MKKLLLIGAGGHARSVIDSIQGTKEYEIAGILDVAEKVGTFLDGIEVIGTDAEMKAYFTQGIRYAFLSLGSIGDTTIRRRVYERALSCGFVFPSIMDVSAVIARNVRIGQGVFVGKNAVINAGTVIGDGCIINTGAVIEHDCRIGDFVHIASGAVLCGDVSVGYDTHIGAGTTVIQGVHIGMHTMIGAGSVVVSDVEDRVKAFGNPCRKKG